MTETSNNPSRLGYKVSLITYFLVFLIASMGPAGAEEKFDSKKGMLGHLSRYIGTDEHLKILDDPYVKREISAMLGSKVRDLIKYIQVRSPVDLISGALILQGSRPQNEGPLAAALIAITPRHGRIHVVLKEGKNISFYFNTPAWKSGGGTYFSLDYATKIFANWKKVYHATKNLPVNLKVYAPNTDGVPVEIKGYE